MMRLKHQAVLRRKWAAARRQVSRHFSVDLPPILFLTDPERVADPVGVAEALPPGSGVIYRHFGAAHRIELARQLSAVCKTRALDFLIAADPELALAVEADGVHWPEARVSQARTWRGRFLLQTASAHSRSAIWRAHQAGMDAALVSAVFPTQSPSAGRPLGAAKLRTLAAAAPLPLYSLGGINAQTAGRVADWSGLSAVSAF